MATMFWRRVAQVVLDAADVDLRQFQASLLERAASESFGRTLSQWAAENPLAFEVLIRGLSATTIGVGRTLRDKGMIAETLARQLEALPYETRRAFTAMKVKGDVRPVFPEDASEADATDLTTTLEWIEAQRKEGEFLGAITREVVLAIAPERLESVREMFMDARPELERSQLMAMATRSPSQVTTMIDQFATKLYELHGVDFTDQVQQAMGDPAKIGAITSTQMMSKGREQFASSLLLGLNAPSSHSPAVSEIYLSLRFLIEHIAEAFRSSAPVEYAPIEFAKLLSSLRVDWLAHSRPASWVEAIDIFASALVRPAVETATR